MKEPGRTAVFELGERVKELNCLYEVATVFAQRQGALRECLTRVVAVLPAACRYPGHVLASLRLDDVEVKWPVDRHESRISSIRAPLRVGGVERGNIELSYCRTTTDGSATGDAHDARVFLAEEQSLLDTVAHQIGVFVASVEAEQRRADLELTLRHADRLATIGQLAAGVAHELNDPLGNVLGFSQLALKTPDLPGQVRTDLGRIVDAALHGREIIRKLLVFARQMPASKQPTAINAVVEEAMFLLEAGCENPGIRFDRELEDGLPNIEADPVQVRQVVTNLVINAMQSITGSGAIKVRTFAEGRFVVLAVEDTGAGMTPEVIRRVFDPFFTTKDVGQGTGLGLAVVQGIVSGHGGSISVESEPTRGSVFRVRLPLNAGKPA
ncbi:MAG: PAS domain-containing sensor histidine kinase [Phycisphaerae bacterium]|nr:PAS domain-containing sensor histidine kinase [Phycisphaerae bacterium]